MEYASRGVANAGLTTGIIGTALSGVMALLGGGVAVANNAIQNPEDRPVSRYELSIVQENAILKAQADVDKKLVEVYNSINNKANEIRKDFNDFEKEQLVYNGVNTATIGCLQNQVQELIGMTKRIIPNGSVCPGWGEVKVNISTDSSTAA